MMNYRLLGRSGLRVSQLCLGTMTFGTVDWGSAESDSAAIYRRYRDAGGNFLDTANEIYAEGRSEEYLGRLIAGHRDEVVLATKFTLAVPGGRDANRGGNHRKSLKRSVEASLKRLKTDHIDLLWMHAWDGVTPVDELMRALDDLVRQGKVLYLGASNTPAWVVTQCQTWADARALTPFVALQCEYNLIERGVESDLLPMAQHLDLTMLAWSPLASGILSGKYAVAQPGADAKRLDTFAFHKLDEHKQAIAAGLADVASQIGCSSPQAALAWLLDHAGVLPVLGARTLAQLDDNLAAVKVQLSSPQRQQLDALSAPALLYPHGYLDQVKPLLYAGFHEQFAGLKGTSRNLC
jgi:aryl-alcohol dehydrogenase-like predicted oxidoreductase